MTFSEILADLLTGAMVTVQIAVGAWAVSALLGMLFAVARDRGMRAAVIPISVLVTVLRSIPQLVVLYLLYFGIGALGVDVPPLIAAILALGVTDAAFSAEYYRAGFMTVPATQREAGLSLGLSPLKVMRLVIIPQTIPFVVPPLLNSFVGLLKTATLAAAVGAPEILYRGQTVMQTTGRLVAVAAIVIGLYIVVTLPLTRLVARLERRVRAYA
ncbi:MAG TPA: amino acid ABC transporter permease [Candidatus Limnocylindrales bacterium]|nr:amino acid ABC transporter permease [Candidatus Limnocylindrales bacterium]